MWNRLFQKFSKDTPAAPDDLSLREAEDAVRHQDWALSEKLFRAILEQRPESAPAAFGLGDALYQQDRLDEAEPYVRQAIAQNTNVGEYHYKLGNILKDRGDNEAAEDCYRTALELSPQLAPAHNNLGILFERVGRTSEAIAAYRSALAYDPTLIQAHSNLIQLLILDERHEEVATASRALAEVAADNAAAWHNLGVACQALAKYAEAQDAYERALTIAPGFIDALLGLGSLHQVAKRFDEAATLYEQALSANPTSTKIQVQLAQVYCSRGEVMRSIELFRRVAESSEPDPDAGRQLLAVILYQSVTNSVLLEEHLAYGRRIGDNSVALGPISPSPNREKLRIGYVSSDLRNHPVAHNLLPIIMQHDRTRHEIYFYDCTQKSDDTSRQFQKLADGWHRIAALGDIDAARLMRKHEIDVLIFLAGRFDANRATIATYRAAPVQISMHDPATSGLAHMDYLLADARLVPRNTTEQFTECVMRLPTFFLHAPIEGSPDIAPPPSQQKGYITFGSFNNPAKISETVVGLWAQILASVPESKLLLKFWSAYQIPSISERYLGLFQRYGIAPERIILIDTHSNRETHLAGYHDIDIALDPFPFAGSTTTFEALWMGVPVVTLAGDHMVARWSSAVLEHLELQQLVAKDPETYVQIASLLACDAPRLAELRMGLRERVARSTLVSAKHRARQIERLSRFAWRKSQQGDRPTKH